MQAHVLYCIGAKTEGPYPESIKIIKSPPRKPHELHKDTSSPGITVLSGP